MIPLAALLAVLAASSPLAAARAAWSSPNACGGQVEYSVRDLGGQFVGLFQAYTDGHCEITIDDDVPPGWPTICTAVHEYGHALGLEHTTDPRSIMVTPYDAMLESDSCRQIRRIFAIRAGPR